MKRVISIILTVCLLLSFSISCFAEEVNNGPMPRYAYISGYNYSLTINSAGTATCTASCSTDGYYNIQIKCYYQYHDGTQWCSFKFFPASGYCYTSLNKQANTISGFTRYRIKVVFTIFDSSNNQLESATYYDYANYIPSN